MGPALSKPGEGGGVFETVWRRLLAEVDESPEGASTSAWGRFVFLAAAEV